MPYITIIPQSSLSKHYKKKKRKRKRGFSLLDMYIYIERFHSPFFSLANLSKPHRTQALLNPLLFILFYFFTVSINQSIKVIPINLIGHNHHPKQKHRPYNLKSKGRPPLLTDAIIL